MTAQSDPLPPVPANDSGVDSPEAPISSLTAGTENQPAPAEPAGEPDEPDNAGADPRPGPDSTFSLPHLEAYQQPQPPPRPDERVPHLGHVALLALLVVFGWLGAFMLLVLALAAHLWGITSPAQATADYHYTLAGTAAQYFITFSACLVVFPPIWRRPFFAGVHWHGSLAIRRSGRLASAALVCFFVAMINGMLMPGPTNAPIDQLFRAPGAAWILFAFGVTLAPFFEEMAFRGFLLPALCTAWDWSLERINGIPRRPPDENGDPSWSLGGMVFASVITSIPFALMHGVQTAWSLGPFLLLVFVSLVLCWVRLSTRSLAASTMVHACYNLMLFSLMLFGTGGFKHLDRM